MPANLSDFNQSHMSQPPLVEHPKIKFHTNKIKDSRIVTSEEMDRQTDMVKLMAKFLQHMSARHKEVGVKNSYPNSSLFSGSDLQSGIWFLLCRPNEIQLMTVTIQFSIKR
jgi:hypothetical protein